VGFDAESDAHRVYWPDRRTVTVERSVKFPGTTADVEVRLEGENGEISTHQETEPVPSPSTPSASKPPTPTPSSTTQPTPAQVDATKRGRPKRVRKESAYVRRLRSGEGTATGRAGEPVLPRGVQAGSSQATIEEVPDEKEPVAMVSEIVEDERVELAMAAAMGESECVEPTYQEAKRRPDWPK
ncbi:hypothetical protein K466DRAFT_460872, partial [Polyporus arcularius HHB13444]